MAVSNKQSLSDFAVYSNNAVICIVTDFILALLPIPLIWTLRISTRSHLSLTFVLGLGLFTAVVGIARQTSVPRMFTEAEPWVRDSYAVWQFIELNVGIIAASSPATKPLLSMFFDPANGFSRGGRSAENDGNNSQGALQERSAQHNEEPDKAHGQEAPPKRARRRRRSFIQDPAAKSPANPPHLIRQLTVSLAPMLYHRTASWSILSTTRTHSRDTLFRPLRSTNSLLSSSMLSTPPSMIAGVDSPYLDFTTYLCDAAMDESRGCTTIP